MYYNAFEFYEDLFKGLVFGIKDLFAIVKGGKEGLRYIKQVPYYCRHHCKYDVRLCRDRRKNWKCRSGCPVMKKRDYGVPYDWTKPEDWEYYKHRY